MSDSHDHSHDVPTGVSGIGSADHLAEHLAEILTPASVIICVGNEICGDDGVGPAIAKELAGRVPWPLFDTQAVPESFLMKIVNCKPDAVVLVDAGSVELFEADRVGGQGPSTHGPAPLAFLELLTMFHPCRQGILGIQPQQADFGQAMCPSVRQAVGMVVEAFVALAEQQGLARDGGGG